MWVPSDGRYLGGGGGGGAVGGGGQESHGGSQARLLSPGVERARWPRGLEFLAAATSFSLSSHTVWLLPVCVMQHGGLTFLLMFSLLLVLLGGPLVMLEVMLGQYSGLAPAQLYRHLCPLLAGLGLTVCLQAALRAMLDLAALTWAALAFYSLFSTQTLNDGFFYSEVLDKGEASLEWVGSLGGRPALVLCIVSVLVFLLTTAGTRGLGKLGLVLVPASFMLMVTLVIRSCLAPGAPQGIITLLSPDWDKLTQPSVWLLAAANVVFSLQLGLGAVTTFSSYNNYHHNIIRDTSILIVSNLVWAILSVLLVFSLLGVTHNLQTINLTNIARDPASLSITGSGLWLLGVTILETALANIATGWLWAGLLFILIFITSLTSIFGLIEVISTSLVGVKSGLTRYKPAVTFCCLTFLFLVDLMMATQGGIHIYHLLVTYISHWPTLLTSLLSLTASLLCLGPHSILSSLVDMSKVRLPHVVISHLSVLYTSLSPALLLASLAHTLHLLTRYHLLQPLSTFDMNLPDWAVSTGWSLSLLPTSPVIFGAIVYLIWADRGTPRLAVGKLYLYDLPFKKFQALEDQ